MNHGKHHEHQQHHHSSGTVPNESKPGHISHHTDHDRSKTAKHGEENVHDKHAGHHTGDFLKRFWICLVLTIPALLLSHMIQQWLGFELKFVGDKYVLLCLGSLIYFYGGWPFLVGMIREIRDKAI